MFTADRILNNTENSLKLFSLKEKPSLGKQNGCLLELNVILFNQFTPREAVMPLRLKELLGVKDNRKILE